ncbi:MAG: outer membrane beta-barrel protein [Cytophagaceae bacterium]|nr:outer membrane beta-barrel protein [Cytophagaceae bacterium]
MKRACLLLLAWMPLALFAQTALTGTVQDETGKPLPLANVLLLHARDSTLVKGAVSTENGAFRFENLRAGTYRVAASAVGYRRVYSASFALETAPGTYQLPPLTTEAEAKQLAEVQVLAQKPLFEQQMDRLVINVQSSITSSGSTVLDVLERAPGLSVNKQANTLAMQGKTGVGVLINGKLSRLPLSAVLQQLSGMAANSVEKIELYANPPARFDAEGDAGLINIILKKNELYGTNGSLSLTAGYGWQPRSGATLALNHRTGRLNLFGTYSLINDRAYQQLVNERTIPVGGVPTRTETTLKRTTQRVMHNLRLGAELSVSPKTTLGILVAGYSNKMRIHSRSNTNLASAAERIGIDGTMQEIHHWRHGMGNLSLRHQFAPSHSLTLDADYLYYFDNNPYQYTYDYRTEGQTEARRDRFDLVKQSPIRVGVFKADYTRALSQTVDLEAGLKGSLFGLTNQINLDRLGPTGWQPDPAFGRNDRLRENIGAAYASVNARFGQKTTLVAGLRYEVTRSLMRDAEGLALVDRRYGSLFPNVLFSIKSDATRSYQLSYSRRITRPPLDQLASFSVFWDPLFFMTGNTGLQPTFTDIVQATYSHTRYSLQVRYSHDRAPISRFFPEINAETNQMTWRPRNIDRGDNLALTLTLPLALTPWWQTQNSLLATYQQQVYRSNARTYRLEQVGGQVNSAHTFRLPRQWSVEAVAWYKFPSVDGINQVLSSWELALGVQKKLRNNAGQFSLTVSDLFWTNQLRLRSYVPELNLDTKAQAYFNEPRVVRLTYARDFGNQKVSVNSKRATGSDEERKRVN